MAKTFGWGQAYGTVAQIAYVVKDLEASIDHFITDLGAGPFFVIPHFRRDGQVYRGGPNTSDQTIAMGFAGQTWIELIQPLDDEPSLYKEVIERSGYGLHHHGIAYDDCEAALADYVARGWTEVFRSPVPTGGEVIFIEGGHPGATTLIELLPASPPMDAHFTSLWRAAQDWDGRDPIRPFI